MAREPPPAAPAVPDPNASEATPVRPISNRPAENTVKLMFGMPPTYERPAQSPVELQTSPTDPAVKRVPAMPRANESHSRSPLRTKGNGHKKSKSGSVSYSTFPNTVNHPGNHIQTDYADFTARSPSTSKANKRQGMILGHSSYRPNFEGVVDLNNTVDTDVATKTFPGTPPPPLPSISEKRRRPLSAMSRSSTISFSATRGISPLHTSPRDIELPPSLPPANWPLTPTSMNSSYRIGKEEANVHS